MQSQQNLKWKTLLLVDAKKDVNTFLVTFIVKDYLPYTYIAFTKKSIADGFSYTTLKAYIFYRNK